MAEFQHLQEKSLPGKRILSMVNMHTRVSTIRIVDMAMD
jgi:hypothetical protein